ncbi:MAG: hypothetical protein LBO20_09265 [Bifidobacteriaceae bacterium]|jgi:hypothetical protein|nr:hypothetical protein [Bifidobacteriaceae bacterium]
MHEWRFLTFLLGAVDAVGVAGAAACLALCVVLLPFALASGGSQTATVKTYRGGRLVGVETHTQSFAESLFAPKFKVIGSKLYFPGQVSQAVRSEPWEGLTATVKYWLWGYCAVGLFVIGYLTVKANTFIHTEDWALLLSLGIIVIVINGVFLGVVMVTSRWSPRLALVALTARVGLVAIAAYNYFAGNVHWKTGLAAEGWEAQPLKGLTIAAVVLWAVTFAACCLLPVKQGDELPDHTETPRAYLFPFAHLYRGVDFGKVRWDDNKSLATVRYGEEEDFMTVGGMALAAALVTSAIGAAVTWPRGGALVRPFFVLWATLGGLVLAIVVKDVVSWGVTKAIAARRERAEE